MGDQDKEGGLKRQVWFQESEEGAITTLAFAKFSLLNIAAIQLRLLLKSNSSKL